MAQTLKVDGLRPTAELEAAIKFLAAGIEAPELPELPEILERHHARAQTDLDIGARFDLWAEFVAAGAPLSDTQDRSTWQSWFADNVDAAMAALSIPDRDYVEAAIYCAWVKELLWIAPRILADDVPANIRDALNTYGKRNRITGVLTVSYDASSLTVIRVERPYLVPVQRLHALGSWPRATSLWPRALIRHRTPASRRGPPRRRDDDDPAPTTRTYAPLVSPLQIGSVE